MALIGYARVSTNGQSLGLQLEQLAEAGCDKTFHEIGSGRAMKHRRQLAAALDWAREGDVLIVTRLDRLARSMSDLQKIIDRLAAKSAGFRCLQQDIDTTTSAGRLTLNMLASFAEFENDIRRERQAEGIARARLAGRMTGRPPSVDPVRLQALLNEGLGPFEIGRRMGFHRTTIERARERLRKQGKNES